MVEKLHKSDCAVHNEPAMEDGNMATQREYLRLETAEISRLTAQLERAKQALEVFAYEADRWDGDDEARLMFTTVAGVAERRDVPPAC